MKRIVPILMYVAVMASLFAGVPRAAQAEYVFTAPPRESPDKGQAMYGPIARHFSDLLGTPVRYEHPQNWPVYTREMRAGSYDLVFDGPHFVSWRIAHVEHQALVKLPGTLVFHLLAGADDSEIQEADDLAGKRICGIAPPNLGTMTVITQFPNPARQPVIVPVKGGFGGVIKAFEAGRCRGAVLRTQFYDKKLSKEQKAALKILSTSSALPNQAISAGPTVSDEHKQVIVKSFTSEQGAQAANGLFNRFARKAKAFEAANNDQFEGHNQLLEGVIWGW